MLWSASKIAAELDLASPNAARSLMDSLNVQAVYLGPGRGRGYRWRPEDIRRAIDARAVGKPPERRNNRRQRETIFDLGLTVTEQMAALMDIGASRGRRQ